MIFILECEIFHENSFYKNIFINKYFLSIDKSKYLLISAVCDVLYSWAEFVFNLTDWNKIWIACGKNNSDQQ